MTCEIKNRWTGDVLFSLETESMRLCVEAAVEARADLAYADLARANLADANLARAYLADANLAYANLARANLADANLAYANLARANLAYANLADADLARANLADANLADANLADADLADANLARADLVRATGIRDVLQIGPIGSRRDYLIALLTDDGLSIRAGCFTGTLAEFAAAVSETHGDNEHARHYRAAIALIRSRFAEHPPKQEAA